MKVQNKVVVVTGGGDGVGRELVLALLAKGARVAAVDINASSLEKTRERAGRDRDSLATYTVDITDRAAVEALPEQVLARFGAVDGVINNAGVIQPFVRLNDLDYATIERVMHVNLFGTLHVTKAFLPHLLARPEAHLVNISSMGGLVPVPGQTIYGAAKSAVKLLTEGLGSELRETKVRVTLVIPGAMATNIAANSGVVLHGMDGGRESKIKIVTPDRAAQIVVDAIERGRDRVLIGSDAKFMDVVYRMNPRRAARFIYDQMRGLLPR